MKKKEILKDATIILYRKSRKIGGAGEKNRASGGGPAKKIARPEGGRRKKSRVRGGAGEKNSRSEKFQHRPPPPILYDRSLMLMKLLILAGLQSEWLCTNAP